MSADTTKPIRERLERDRREAAAENAAYDYLYRNAQHQNVHAGWPGETTPEDHCDACRQHAVNITERLRPVHYREAARSLRGLLDGLLPIDDRTMGLRYAATCLERTAQDLEGERSR